LISSPTAISMMTGVFHFIAVFLDLISCRWQKPGCREGAADPTDMMIDLMDSGFAPVAAVLSFIADNGATPGSIR
jgi:hypothetical protein